MIVSPKAAKEEGDKFGQHPVCAGPYKFVERVPQDRIVFEKFADYWNKDSDPSSIAWCSSRSSMRPCAWPICNRADWISSSACWRPI